MHSLLLTKTMETNGQLVSLLFFCKPKRNFIAAYTKGKQIFIFHKGWSRTIIMVLSLQKCCVFFIQIWNTKGTRKQLIGLITSFFFVCELIITYMIYLLLLHNSLSHTHICLNRQMVHILSFTMLLYHLPTFFKYDSIISVFIHFVFQTLWISLLHHVCNQDQWIDSSCAHKPIPDDAENTLPWFDRRDKDFQALQEVILSPRRLAYLILR